MINTMELAKQVTATGKRSGGREGRRALRAVPMASFPTLVRKIPAYQMVPDEAVELIHEESLTILEEVGCEFRDDEAIAMWKAAGADVTGTRVRIDRALLMELVAKVPSGIHPQCAQPGAHGARRRQELDLRADVWRALCARPRQQAGATARSPTSTISTSSPTWRRRCIPRARSSASRWKSRCRSGICTSSIRR